MATDSELTKLRRARARVHRQLDKLETLLAGYHAKLADLNARIQVLAPELNLPPRRYKPNPHFARNELPRLALSIMREANGPLSTKEVCLRALAAKGVTLPDIRTLRLTRKRLAQTFADWGKRGIVEKVGAGKEGRRTLSAFK